MVQFLSLYYPYLALADCQRVVDYYTPKPPPPRPPVKLNDIEGAEEEISVSDLNPVNSDTDLNSPYPSP